MKEQLQQDTRAQDLYKRAGIEDRAAFYKTRYVSPELLASQYFDVINRFDIRWARTMWIYDNVRRGSSLLDLGCGSGVLGLLKRKEVHLAGIDLAPECAEVARRNGYDEVSVGEMTTLPFKNESFDYVVSLDVFGHIEVDDKEGVISEIRRVLKPAGVTLHGIECLDRSRRKDYDEMTEEELCRYVQIDGHVGMEDEPRTKARFESFFAHVDTRYGFSLCQSHSEFLKQSDDYGRNYCESDFLSYLRQMSFKERRAFDMAMGYVFEKIAAAGMQVPSSEYLFLKASNQPLGSFYNEHLDRSDLEITASNGAGSQVLDFSPNAAFDSGWYAPEQFPPIGRWMAERAAVRFEMDSVSTIRFQVQSHLPDIETNPLNIIFFLNGIELRRLQLDRKGWTNIEIDARPVTSQLQAPFEFEIRADRVWQPNLVNPDSPDDRQLSIALCNLEVVT